LIVADEASFVEYLEGCTAPSYDTNQFHAAVVEYMLLWLNCMLLIMLRLSIPRSRIGIPVMKKGKEVFTILLPREDSVCRCKVKDIMDTHGDWVGYYLGPSVVLEGDDSVGEFYSVALTNNYQQADAGTKLIHKGKNTRNRMISKGISAGRSRNIYRGLVQVPSKAHNARNSSQCDSMLIGDKAAANTYPYIQVCLLLVLHSFFSFHFLCCT